MAYVLFLIGKTLHLPSTVHKDMTDRLPRINAARAGEVKAVLELNKSERHIRGGQATLRKYKG